MTLLRPYDYDENGRVVAPLILSLSKEMSGGIYGRNLPAQMVRQAHPRIKYGASYEREWDSHAE